MSLTNTLPTLPDLLFHGAAVEQVEVDAGPQRRVRLGRLDLHAELLKGLRVKVFESADMEWLDFILLCRPLEGVPHDYDVVIGPTADDDTNRALKFYYDGTYGRPGTVEAKRMLLRVLETDKLGRQLYIASQSVADRLVKRFESVDWRQYA